MMISRTAVARRGARRCCGCASAPAHRRRRPCADLLGDGRTAPRPRRRYRGRRRRRSSVPPRHRRSRSSGQWLRRRGSRARRSSIAAAPGRRRRRRRRRASSCFDLGRDTPSSRRLAAVLDKVVAVAAPTPIAELAPDRRAGRCRRQCGPRRCEAQRVSTTSLRAHGVPPGRLAKPSAASGAAVQLRIGQCRRTALRPRAGHGRARRARRAPRRPARRRPTAASSPAAAASRTRARSGR